MIFSNKNHELIRQNEKNVKKPQKHDVNLQKNSTLYFQVGLILCLLFSYGLLEMKFLKSELTIPDMAFSDDPTAEYTMDTYEIYKEPVKEKIVEPQKQPKYSDQVEVAKNDSDLDETPDKLFNEELPQTNQDVNPSDVNVIEIPEPINIMAVEKVPVFPGCEGATSNEARRQCMSEKLTKFVQKKFDADIINEVGLTGKQKIFVNFKINTNGEVEILETSAPHKKLKDEANRVVGKLPNMVPGQHGNKKVEVLYTLPIGFNIKN